MKPVIVIAAGGHAKVVTSVLKLMKREVMGLVDIDPKLSGKKILGAPVLGGDEVVTKMGRDKVHLANGVGSIGDMSARKKTFDRFKQDDFEFATLIHPSAIVAEDVAIGEGSQVMAGVILQPGVRIGRNCIINTGAIVDHDCVIGDHVHLAPGATLSGEVTIEDCTHIGIGTVVKQGVRIGRDCVVGAASLLLEDVPSGKKVFGAPARIQT